MSIPKTDKDKRKEKQEKGRRGKRVGQYILKSEKKRLHLIKRKYSALYTMSLDLREKQKAEKQKLLCNSQDASQGGCIIFTEPHLLTLGHTKREEVVAGHTEV